MDRLEELKIKGWQNLNKEEREEYKILNKGNEIKEDQKDETKIIMSKEELQRFVENQIAEFKKKEAVQNQFKGGISDPLGPWVEYKEPAQANRTATFRRFRENGDSPFGLIIDWRFFENSYDELTRRHDKPIYTITVMYDDGEKKEYKIEWLKFAGITEIERVEIIQQDKKTLAQVTGKVAKAFTDNDGYIWSPHAGGGQVKVKGEISTHVPLLVKRDVIVCTVQRENGQTFVINADRLNG